MTHTTTIDRVRNYQGNNSFVIKMKDSLMKWGTLTVNQISAVEKCLSATVTEFNSENLPEDIKKIVDYKGESTFVKDIAEKFKTFGSLTEKQKTTALAQIQKEENQAKVRNLNWKTFNETIKVGRKTGQDLKERYGLEFNPVLIDVTKVLSVSPKAVKFAGKMTVQRGKVCVCCFKTLTDEFSMLTNMGKTCARHLGVEYITNREQAVEFRERYLKKVEEIGEMEFWIPKSQIKKWDGKSAEPVLEWIKF